MVCPTCSAPYQPGDRFCGSCGERLGESASAPAAAARPANPWDAAPPAGAPAPSMPAMPQFEGGGATIAAPPGGAFGQSPFGAAPAPAGMPAGGPSGPATCPTCSAPIEPTDTTCLVCGAELRPGMSGAGSPSPFGGPPPAGPFGAPPEPAAGPFGSAPPASPFGGASGSPFGSPEPAGSPFGGSSPSSFADTPGSPITGPVPGAASNPFGEPPRPAFSAPPPAPSTATQRPTSEPVEARGGGAICPIHGVMKDPSWTRCPDCIREGRDGRLIPASSAGTIDMSSAAFAPPAPVEPPAYAPPPQPPFTPAPEPPSFNAAPPTPPPPAFAPAAPVPAAGPAGGDEGRPVSSVGQTFVIRRKPRSLAFLIEKEGEQVGRVFQLERDVTDLGRDPRNHIVVSDVLVSGFHARVERGGDGGLIVTDRGSTNGTRLNGEPLSGSRPMVENDELGVGNTTLVLKVVQ